jgi:predicted AlkP superfamily pyrophosphatase or phosphodiesterase
VGWPVSVGADSVDYLIPEYWRVSGMSEGQTPSDRDLIAALSRPETMLAQMQDQLGPYMMGNDTTLAGDEIKTRYALEILKKQKPAFMTIHLSSLDESEHEHGPFSMEANKDLEAIDGMVSRLADAARANDPSAVVLVVSDHGFVPLTHQVNLNIPFLQAGLIKATVSADGKSAAIASWTAQPWLASGMVAIMIRDSNDLETRKQVSLLLQKLASDPNNGISAVLDSGEIKKHGGFPDAAFLVAFRPGYYTGGNWSGDVVTTLPGSRGGHGFSPDFPELRASFFIAGQGIAHHRDLGVIDMRQIAPTVAGILKVSLPAAEAKPLHIQP